MFAPTHHSLCFPCQVLLVLGFVCRIVAGQDFGWVEPNGQRTQWLKEVENTVQIRFELGRSEEIDAMTRVCGLSESQQMKLKLASRGDLLRTLRHISELGRQWISSDREAQHQVAWEINFLSDMSGEFGDESRFYKTLRKILTDEQRSRYLEMARRRQEAVVRRALILIDEGAKGSRFSDETRQQVVNLFMKHSETPTTVTPYSNLVVFLHAAKLEPSLRALTDDAQWISLQKRIVIARAMEPMLQKTGVLPELQAPLAAGHAAPPREDADNGR